MSRVWILVLIATVLLDGIICPPVTPKKEEVEEEDDADRTQDPNFGLEYERYLKEVVGVLESDEEFRRKLEQSNVSEIKSGEIARHLEFVSHSIRTKLDEIKRREIDRLRQAMKLQHQLERGMPRLPINPALLHRTDFNQQGVDANLPRLDKEKLLNHVDHRNPNSFEVEDLAKLIQQATRDLEDIDQQRRKEFKQYEMEKEVDKRERLKEMDDVQRAAEMEKLEEMSKKHADHPKLHHPGSKDQLEEVWEEGDGMDKEDFNPRTFFALHDTNGDGVLDESEVEALFQKELDKMYDPNNPEDDLIERYEEMNRMREHVFNEVDANKDKMIELDEFLKSTAGKDFEKDEGWDTLEQNKQYTDEELEQFVREYEERQRQEYAQQGHPIPQDPSQPQFDHIGQGQGQGQPVQMHQQEQQHVDMNQVNQKIQDIKFEPNQQLNQQFEQQQQQFHQQQQPEHQQQQQPEHHQQQQPEHHQQQQPEQHQQQQQPEQHQQQQQQPEHHVNQNDQPALVNQQ